ncbi:MAG: cytochrome b [Betaproteobacteria bacterium]
MSPSDSIAARYTATAIALHWGIALLVVAQFAWGWWMQEIPKQPVGPRVDAYNLHKSCGLVILALMLFRLGWRIGHPPPPLPPMPRWQAWLAAATHVTVYAALFAMPLSGYLGSAFSGYPVKFFGMTLPAWAPKSVPLKTLMEVAHLTVSWILAAATLLHFAGAAIHAVAADGLLARMGVGRPAARRS